MQINNIPTPSYVIDEGKLIQNLEILKNVQESLKDDDESSNAQLTDFFMGQVSEKLADQMVDQVGDRMTQTLYEQMCRNYNIKNE